jgi:phosphohistidine swiveling domain-containing protein
MKTARQSYKTGRSYLSRSIESRELGIPAVVGLKNATTKIRITNGYGIMRGGDIGKVYKALFI